MLRIVLIAHDIRSCHNVGSLLRTAEGLGIEAVYLSGYTPYPTVVGDTRLPHIATKLSKDIHKTALDAENLVPWRRVDDVFELIRDLKRDGYHVAALEQSDTSIPLPDFKTPAKLAVLLGREVEGIEEQLIQLCDTVLEIPMFGKKESFNVVQSAAMMLYHCRFAK